MNEQNFHYYLRWLVKIADERPLRYEEIPQKFIDFFSLPGLSQAINIRIDNKPEVDYDKVENFLIGKTFSSFNEVASAIHDNFESDYEKLYACFYYVANTISYDIPRSLLKERDPLTIQTIFDTGLGVCAEYSKYFRELAKLCGIPSKKILRLQFINASKGAGWDSYNPPNEPIYKHEANFIKIQDQFYISEPTWASGSSDENHQFITKYNRSYFLIPYYKGITDHFPEKKLDDSLNDHFTWQQYISINKPDIRKDLCFESNPFQKITVENGLYEMQFSFIQPVECIFGYVYVFEDQKWNQIKNFTDSDNLISYKCLRKNMPSLNFSHSKELRCRYKMTIKFPKEGEYKLETYINNILSFTSYFTVKGKTSKLDFISGCDKENHGFNPITPQEGLTKINNGFARIRFTLKLSRSDLLIKLFELNKETLDQIKQIEGHGWYNYFATNLPFNYDSEDKDLNDYLVENWVLINFPNEGLFEVKIYFANEEGGNYSYGVTYYFDVTGVRTDNIIYPYYDLPNNRTFVPLTIDGTDEIRVVPSEKTVILEEHDDFYFHVFSEKLCNVVFRRLNTSEAFFPELMPGEITDSKNITDRKYSAPKLNPGAYNLIIISDDGNTSATQNYFILNTKLPKESSDEKKMMKELKTCLEGKDVYLSDIPLSIRDDVEKMVAQSINDYKPSNVNLQANESSELESEEERAKLKMKIIELNKIVSDLGKQNEEKEKYASKLEQEKNEISKIANELRKQKEDQEKYTSKLEQERNEISSKMSDNKSNKDEMITKLNELKNQTSILENEKALLNNKINELLKQKEEEQNHTRSLEQKNNEINQKLEKLLKQKEDIDGKQENKEMATELKELEIRKQELENQANNLKQEKDDLNNKFNKLAMQKEEQEKRAKKLEQEKNELDNKVNELEKQKEEIMINMAKEKSIADSKVHSYENIINDLMKQKEEQENRVKNLEQEKEKLSKKVNKLKKQKGEIISKEGTESSTNDISSVNTELYPKDPKSSKSKYELQVDKNPEERKSDQPDIESNPDERKSDQIERKWSQQENESNPDENNSNQVETKSNQPETELSPDERKLNQKERKSKRKKRKSRQPEIESNPDKNNSNQKETKSSQPEIESNPDERKLNQKERKSKRKKRKSSHPEIESNSDERKLDQIERKSNQPEIESNSDDRKSDQIERQSSQPEIELNPKERKSIQAGIEINHSGIEEPKPNSKPNSPRRKTRQNDYSDFFYPPILPRTPPPKNIPKCKRPIKLTVTLKDIGMENFDQPYSSLHTLNTSKMITNSQDSNRNDSREEREELPRLFKHNKKARISAQTHDEVTQTQPLKKIKLPSYKKEISYNYDPSIFYTPICPESPVSPVRYFKDPVGLTVTLKDIGMDEF